MGLSCCLSGNIHTCTEREDGDGKTKASQNLWSLGFLMLEVMEKGSTILPKFQHGEALKFEHPQLWSAEAGDFLQNTSTVSTADLADVGTYHSYIHYKANSSFSTDS